jgi:site-specific DNA-cytosine methylase
MLVGARAAGFDVVGNVEWRKYYHRRDDQGRNTFTQNFKGAFLVHALKDLTPEQVKLAQNCDLAMGHPECGKYSQMNNNNANFREQLHDPGDIPLFTEMISMLRPRFFVMDDLPKSFIAYSAKEYAAQLPEYDLFFEWISNYHYGNIQKNRLRLFVIGALKKERFTFVPGEFEHSVSVRDTIEDLMGREGKVDAHFKHELDSLCAKGLHMLKRGHRAKWRDVRKLIAHERGGFVLPYVAEDGSRKTRPGSYKAHWDKHAHVMDGGSPALHPINGVPFTIRERARIQGFPDSFKFYGIRLNEKGEWNHDKNIELVKQTGKAMPIQFCTYAAKQIAAHISKKPWKSSGERFGKRNEYVDQAKRWYCQNVGYSTAPGRACSACWMAETCPKYT